MQRHRKAEPWPDVLQRAQRSVAERLEREQEGGGFDLRRYAAWLIHEAGVAVLCAEAMEALAGWHAGQPALRATAQAWAAELRELARLAATDLRAIGGATPAPPPVLDEWRVFLAGASTSQRAGEALGAVALHSRVLPGKAGAALAALRGMPFARAASHYPARRGQDETDAVRNARDLLLDAYASAALAAGARRAAVWELDVINQTGIEHAMQYS